MKEEWRDIAGYEGLYQVSDLGRVRSLDRTKECTNRWGQVKTRNYKGKILNPGVYGNGYNYVYLGRGGPSFLVHRLVLKSFVGLPTFESEVNHKNGIKDDNRLSNLEWVSSSENKLHSYRYLDRKPHAKKTPVKLIGYGKELLFDSEIEAAKYLAVSQASVNSARTRDHRCCGYIVVNQ